MELELSGNEFVWWYGIIACLTTGAVLLWRRRAGRGPEVGDPAPEELALLAGGSPLAIAGSLAALRVANAVAADGLRLLRIGPAHEGATALDHAVLDAVARNASPDTDPRVRRIIMTTGWSLAERGLLLDSWARRRLREGAIPVAALALLAGVLTATRYFNDLPVRQYAEVTLAVTAAAAALLHAPRLPRRTRALLDRLRAEGEFLRDGWHTFGPETAALAVAVHGPEVITNLDPAFAVAASRFTQYIPLHRPPAKPPGASYEPGLDTGPTGPVGWHWDDRDGWGGDGGGDGGGGGS